MLGEQTIRGERWALPLVDSSTARWCNWKHAVPTECSVVWQWGTEPQLIQVIRKFLWGGGGHDDPLKKRWSLPYGHLINPKWFWTFIWDLTSRYEWNNRVSQLHILAPYELDSFKDPLSQIGSCSSLHVTLGCSGLLTINLKVWS